MEYGRKVTKCRSNAREIKLRENEVKKEEVTERGIRTENDLK